MLSFKHNGSNHAPGRLKPNGQKTAKPRRKSRRYRGGIPKAWKLIPEFRRLVFGFACAPTC